MSKTFTIFTYGTLMKGFKGHEVLMKHANFICDATISGHMRHLSSGYPVIIADEEKGAPISGELYEVNESTMNSLRQYEGIGSPLTCYTEKVVKVDAEFGTTIARAFVAIPSLKIPVKISTRPISERNWRTYTASNKRTLPSPMFMTFSFSLLAGIIWQISTHWSH